MATGKTLKCFIFQFCDFLETYRDPNFLSIDFPLSMGNAGFLLFSNFCNTSHQLIYKAAAANILGPFQ